MVTHDSKSDLPLILMYIQRKYNFPLEKWHPGPYSSYYMLMRCDKFVNGGFDKMQLGLQLPQLTHESKFFYLEKLLLQYSRLESMIELS